jgi:hypothetical protein
LSPFATIAANYRERGLAIMPCGPGTKFPGRHSPDGWHVAFDWQKYCDRLPTSFELDIWERWPDAGVCLALGRSSAPAGFQLIAADIDTEEPDQVAAIRAVLPGSPVRKRGAKGETEFYLAPDSVPNRPYNDASKRRMLDLLGHGRQTVLPPTIHPDTGAAYHWTTLDTLDNFEVADLPVLPADIADILSRALAPFGHEDAPTMTLADPATGEISTHRELNNQALENLHALNLYKCRQVAGKYKAVAHWRPSSSGRPLSARATNLIISADGIRDKGEERGYTPLDLVMAACEADLDTAFRWLQERVAPAPPIVLMAAPRAEPPTPAPPPARMGNLLGIVQPNGDIVPVQPVSECREIAVIPQPLGLIPPDLCTPPGLIGDLTSWIISTDEAPMPQLALGAAIAFLGALIGRRWAHPSKGARSNYYCVGVAPTGFGKGHAPLAIKELARAASVDGFLGPGRFKSESAIRKALEAKPTQCAMMDELGGVMRSILSKKASSHEAGIRDILLELFSCANTTYAGSEGASEKAVPIVNPNLTIYGASTPGDLWGNFSSGSAADGFLPRWLVFDGGDVRPAMVDATADVFDPPQSLSKAIHALLDTRPAGNLNGLVANKPITAAWGDGAQAWFRALRTDKEAEIDIARGARRSSEEVILSRFAEHVAKLSLLYAVCINARTPVITVASLEWARDVVAHSCAALIAAIEGKVADSDAQAQYLWVRGEIAAAGADGVLESVLIKRVNGRWDSRRHADILAQLQAAGVIWRAMKTPAGGGRPGQRVGIWAEGEREVG